MIGVKPIRDGGSLLRGYKPQEPRTGANRDFPQTLISELLEKLAHCGAGMHAQVFFDPTVRPLDLGTRPPETGRPFIGRAIFRGTYRQDGSPNGSGASRSLDGGPIAPLEDHGANPAEGTRGKFAIGEPPGLDSFQGHAGDRSLFIEGGSG